MQTGADSTTSLRTATNWPALTGLGVSQSVFTLAPCTLRSPHIHQRASGILYAYNGKICILCMQSSVSDLRWLEALPESLARI